VQRVSFEGARQLAMRVWIDPDRLAALGLAPGDVQAALRRNNYLAAVGRRRATSYRSTCSPTPTSAR
jgi:multidrug efflux pump